MCHIRHRLKHTLSISMVLPKVLPVNSRYLENRSDYVNHSLEIMVLSPVE